MASKGLQFPRTGAWPGKCGGSYSLAQGLCGGTQPPQGPRGSCGSTEGGPRKCLCLCWEAGTESLDKQTPGSTVPSGEKPRQVKWRSGPCCGEKPSCLEQKTHQACWHSLGYRARTQLRKENNMAASFVKEGRGPFSTQQSRRQWRIMLPQCLSPNYPFTHTHTHTI